MLSTQKYFVVHFALEIQLEHSFRKVMMAEEKEREVKNAAKDLVKSQRRAAR